MLILVAIQTLLHWFKIDDLETQIESLESLKKTNQDKIREDLQSYYSIDTDSNSVTFQKKVDFNNLIGSKKNEVISENNEVVDEVMTEDNEVATVAKSEIIEDDSLFEDLPGTLDDIPPTSNC